MTFNPWRGECGFYPPDVFNQVGPVVVLKTRRKLSSGHKLLYAKLVHRWGREGPCYPGQADLAKSTGSSVRAVRIWLEDLEAFGLIERRRRGRGKGGKGQSDEYSFLRHPIFDRHNPSVLTGKNGDYDRQESSIMTGKVRPSLYKEETYTGETDTSTTTESSPLLTVGEIPESARKQRWWTPEEFQQARAAVGQHFRRNRLPDPVITERVLAALRSMQDFKIWMAYLDRHIDPCGIHGFGFYASHARDQWPGLRAEVEEQHAAALARAASERERVEAEAERVDEELRLDRADRSRQEVASAMTSAPTPDPTRCNRCGNFGMFETPGAPDQWAWCACAHAAARREREPSLVAKSNAIVQRLLEIAPRPAKTPEPTRAISKAPPMKPPRCASDLNAAISALAARKRIGG